LRWREGVLLERLGQAERRGKRGVAALNRSRKCAGGVAEIAEGEAHIDGRHSSETPKSFCDQRPRRPLRADAPFDVGGRELDEALKEIARYRVGRGVP
jgi:hypothetical protein